MQRVRKKMSNILKLAVATLLSSTVSAEVAERISAAPLSRMNLTVSLIQLGDSFYSSDHVNGFCKLSPTFTIVNPAADCIPGGSGQAVFKPSATGGVVFVPDEVSDVVLRLRFNSTTQTLTPLTPITSVPVPRLTGVALSPNGDLYVSGRGSNPQGANAGVIYRVVNPTSSNPNIATLVGYADSAPASMAFIGEDLLIAGETSLLRIQHAKICSDCVATPVPGVNLAGVTSVVTKGENVFATSETGVYRIEFGSLECRSDEQIEEVITTSYAVDPTTTAEFDGLSALAFDKTGNMFLVATPIALIDAPNSASVFRIPQVYVANAIGTCGVPPNVLPPVGPGLVQASPFARGSMTLPTGLFEAGGTPWVVDHLLGVCKLTNVGVAPFPNDIDVLNILSCIPGLVAENAVFDSTNNYLYVAGAGDGFFLDEQAGVWRVEYNVALNRFETPELISVFPLGDQMTIAFNESENAVYVGSRLNPSIRKISNVSGPIGTISIANIGNIFGAKAPGAFAILNNNLYIAEDDGLGFIENVSACSSVSPCSTSLANFTGVALPSTLTTFDGKLYVGQATHVQQVTETAPGVGTSVVYMSEIVPTPGLIDTRPINVLAIGFRQDGSMLLADDPTLSDVGFPARVWTAPAVP
jgi:hypothetical protein